MADLEERMVIGLSQRGFTLLEILVVMVVMAGLVAVAGPRLNTLYSSVQGAAERDDVVDQVRGLAQQARRKGQAIEFSGWPAEEFPADLQIPEQWEIHVDSPIQFQASGACLGGVIRLRRAAAEYEYVMEPPYCEPVER